MANAGISDAERDAAARTHFACFVREFFPLVAPGHDLAWAPYLDVTSAFLGDIAMGNSADLVINMPPRHLKSVLVSVLLPAFFLGHFPHKQVLCISYAQDLAEGFAALTRKVMTSARYLELFETRLVSPRASLRNMHTVHGGVRRATSMKGIATGRGTDLMLFDDPQKAADALSEVVRKRSNDALQNTFLSRRTLASQCPIVVVMQRLHEDDFTGHVLNGEGDWAHLVLPAVAEVDEHIVYDTVFGRRAYTRRAGEPLQAHRISLAELDKIRLEVGESVWTTQYEQRPSPAGGGVVEVKWFGRYTPEQLARQVFDRVVQSWDTAIKIEEHHAFSVGTTWGERDGQRWLLHVYRGRLNYPDLRRMVIQYAQAHGADVVVVEDKGSGTQLLQELKELGFYKAKAALPTGDKEMRMRNHTALIESGAVLLPFEAPWLLDYLHELIMFPNARFNDQVDSTSQALAFMTKPMPGRGLYDYYQQEDEAATTIPLVKSRRAVRMQGPAGMGLVRHQDGRESTVKADGFFHFDQQIDIDEALRRPGWSFVPDEVIAAPDSYVARHGRWPSPPTGPPSLK